MSTVALGASALFGATAAGAADSADGSTGSGAAASADGARHPRPQLTDEQKQCLADEGVTLPEKPADGSRPQLTDEQRAALRAAAEKCGLPAPGHGGPGGGTSESSTTSA